MCFFFLVSRYGHMRFDSVGGPVTHPEPHCFASSLYLTLFLAPCTNWKRRNHSSELKQEGQVGTILFPELLRDSESIYKMLSLGYPLTWPVLRCFGISLQILQVEERDERPKARGALASGWIQNFYIFQLQWSSKNHCTCPFTWRDLKSKHTIISMIL